MRDYWYLYLMVSVGLGCPIIPGVLVFVRGDQRHVVFVDKDINLKRLTDIGILGLALGLPGCPDSFKEDCKTHGVYVIDSFYSASNIRRNLDAINVKNKKLGIGGRIEIDHNPNPTEDTLCGQ